MDNGTLTPRQLIDLVVARDQTLDEPDLGRVMRHVADVSFDPTAVEEAGGRLSGLVWNGRVLRGRDRLPPVDVHYLRHVVAGREWPDGTTLDEYIASLRAVCLDPQSGVLVSLLRRRFWQITAVGPSGASRGPDGHDWIAVEYRVETGHWVTGFQPARGLGHFADPSERQHQRWLRPPPLPPTSTRG